MKFFLFIFFLFSTSSLFAEDNAGGNILQLGEAKKYDLSGYLSRYIQGSSEVPPELAYRYFEAGKFRNFAKTNNEYINNGLVNNQTWFALLIENTRPYESSMVLEYVLSGANSVECYTVNDKQDIQPLIKSKNNYNTTSNGLLAKSETFNLNLQPGEKIILLMHTENKGQLLFIPARLYDLTYFKEFNGNKHTFFGIFQGIFLFIIAFNLLIYLTTLDRIYLFYLLYAFFISLFALNEVGTATYSLSFLPFINYFSGQTFLFIGFSIWLLLMLQFLNLAKDNIKLYKITIAFAAIDLFFALLPYMLIPFGLNDRTHFQEFYQSSIALLFAANLLFIVIANIVRIVKGSRLAIFYAVANIPVLLGAIIYYGNYYDVSNIRFGWLSPLALGLSIETFLISFGFAYRYNLTNKEKQKLLIHVNEQQRTLTQSIITTQELEQKRIAEDLHDELGGNLAAIKMTLQSFRLEEAKSNLLIQLIDNASTNARNIAHNLMPPEFENTSLQDLLDKFYLRLNTEGKIIFHFHCTGNKHPFNKQQELMIYRIIMELTNNIIKHAEATEATIQFIYFDNHLELMVEDNGKGLSKEKPNGIGLRTIQSRIHYLKGKIVIDSADYATTVMIQIPYNNE